MGTTANKLAYLKQTKTILKNKINELTGSIKEDTTFSEYAGILEDLCEDYHIITETGTDIKLDDCHDSKTKIQTKGNTSQKSYQGYNLFNIANSTNQNTTFTYTNDILTIQATGDAYNRINLRPAEVETIIKTNPSKVLKFRFDNIDLTQFDSVRDDIIQLAYDINGATTYKTLLKKDTSESSGYKLINFTIPNDTSGMSNFRFGLYVNNSSTVNNTSKIIITKPMFYFDNNNTWEPYIGGNPAPNPDYPQDIKIVKGNNNVKIQNKNLFDKTTAIRNKTFTSQDVVSDSTGLFVSDYIRVKPNKTYYINEYASVVIGLDSDNNSLGYIRNTANAGSFVTPNNCTYVRIRSHSTTIEMETAISSAQLEEGLTATTYVEHKEQNYLINLGNIELCKIGDYQDLIFKNEKTNPYYDNTLIENAWYKKQLIASRTYNGTENFQIGIASNDNYYIFQTAYQYELSNKSLLVHDALSDRFVCNGANSGNNNREEITFNYTSPTYLRFTINASRLTEKSVQAFQTWLSNNNVIIYYVLATPIDTQITDSTLIAQLNQLQKASTYEGTTYITPIQASGNEQFILTVIACKQGNGGE